jgi:hypothetical protein
VVGQTVAPASCMEAANATRTGQTTGTLAAILGIGDEALRRSIGLAATPADVRNGRRRPARVRKTMMVQAAGRIVRAVGIPPCEVPGL